MRMPMFCAAMAASALLMLLFGCSDAGSSTAGSGSGGGQQAYASLAEAGACVSGRYGQTVYAAAENRHYICDGSNWLLLPEFSSTWTSSTGEVAGWSSQGDPETGCSEWSGSAEDGGVSEGGENSSLAGVSSISGNESSSSSSASLGFMCWRNDCARDMVGHWEGGDSCSYNGRNYIVAYTTSSVPGEVFTAYMTLDECVYPGGQSSWGSSSGSSSAQSSSTASCRNVDCVADMPDNLIGEGKMWYYGAECSYNGRNWTSLSYANSAPSFNSSSWQDDGPCS